MKRVVLKAMLVLLVASIAQANYVTNPSFEDTAVTGLRLSQGNLPDDWVNIAPPTPAADTYSNDGSWGISPGGNFTGVTAKDGLRWVAGWSAAGQENFGQYLGSNLTANSEYTMSGWLHQATRSDLNYPGGYEIYLTEDHSYLANSIVLDEHTSYLGFLGSTSSVSEGWKEYSFTFTATDAMTSLGFLGFAPIATAGGSAYPGLDLVSLVQIEAPGSTPGGSPVPAPGALLLGTCGAGAVGWMRRRRSI